MRQKTQLRIISLTSHMTVHIFDPSLQTRRIHSISNYGFHEESVFFMDDAQFHRNCQGREIMSLVVKSWPTPLQFPPPVKPTQGRATEKTDEQMTRITDAYNSATQTRRIIIQTCLSVKGMSSSAAPQWKAAERKQTGRSIMRIAYRFIRITFTDVGALMETRTQIVDSNLIRETIMLSIARCVG